MPLAPQRLQTRGFNQAWELAHAIHKKSHSQAGLDAFLLLRIKHTRAQSELKRSERLGNVHEAFVVDPLRQAQLKDTHVVLVDDVMTSGASLYTAAKTLRAAGVAKVSALVVARTEQV